MKDVEIIGMLKSYVSKSLVGMGALKGANCQIESIAEVTGGQKITFLWIDTNNVSHRSELTVPNGADGVGIANIEKTSTAGLVDTYTITLTNSNTYTFEVTNGAKGDPGDDGFSPTIVEDPDNTNEIYKLDITTKEGSFVTPNLKGGIDSISVNGVAQTISNKSVNLDVASNLITEEQWTQIQALLV